MIQWKSSLGLFNISQSSNWYMYSVDTATLPGSRVHACIRSTHHMHDKINSRSQGQKHEAKNAPTRSRTADLMIARNTSHELYQLSYKSIHWMAPFQLMIHQFYAILRRNARCLSANMAANWMERGEIEHGSKRLPGMEYGNNNGVTMDWIQTIQISRYVLHTS